MLGRWAVDVIVFIVVRKQTVARRGRGILSGGIVSQLITGGRGGQVCRRKKMAGGRLPYVDAAFRRKSGNCLIERPCPLTRSSGVREWRMSMCIGDRWWGFRIFVLALCIVDFSVFAVDPFVIQVVDSKTGRGIPLVKLTTVNKIVYYTDSAGVIAFDEPGLMKQAVYFLVESDGYRLLRMVFGFSGQSLRAVPGSKATLSMHRINLAERLYRVTGQGIYHHSVQARRPCRLIRVR